MQCYIYNCIITCIRYLLDHVARAQVSPIPQIPEEETPTPPVDEPEVIEPDTYEGKIEVRKADGSSLGYISAVQRSNGIFKYGATEENALKVSVSLEAGTVSGTGLAVTMLVRRFILLPGLLTLYHSKNSDGPLFGLIQGRDSATVDIETGSSQCVFATKLYETKF